MNDPLGENLYALFARQAARTPDAVAIIGDDETSYAELATRAEEIACFLSARGLGPEAAVGVVMGRHWQMIASLLGVLKAGASYVPCDPAHPAERTARMLELAECAVVLGDRSTTRSLSVPAEVIAVEEIGPVPAASPAAACAPGGARRAYVLFTSGSTGRPKGVEIEHRSLVNLLCATRDLIAFTRTDRFLATSTVAFDISAVEFFVPLITGGSLLLRERSLLLEPARLAAEIRRFGITVVQTGPSVWELILERAADLPKLRVAITTGEAIAPELAARLVAVGEQVWNLYGPTETTVWATGHRLGADPLPSSAAALPVVPIGTALANIDTIVVDDMGLPVADGERGELWVSGVCVARGYCGNPALTKARFVKGPGERRFYRTGDLVSRVDGALHYFGRNDDQVQVHGVRVEPREVEAAVLHDPAVAHTAATWFDCAERGRSIGAAVVLEPGASRSVTELRQLLSQRLPAQMIPSRVVFVDSIPISSSGKVDRAQIRQALSADPASTGPTVAASASSPTEQALRLSWETVLGIDRVGPDDLFILLGGDSLAAFRLLLEIETEFEVILKPVEVFDLTVKEMAARIEELRYPACEDSCP